MTNRRKLAISILIAMFLLLASVGSVWATSRGGETGKHNHFNTGNRGRNHSGRTHRAVGIFDRASMLEVVATQLGLSVTELGTAYQEGMEALLELGVDQASLRNAIMSAKSQLLAETVAAGTITQAEANEMNFSFGHWGKAAHRGPHLPDFMDIARLQELAADSLGLTEEELEAAKTEGLNSLDLDRATVVAALHDAWQQLVDEAVAADTITQAEADELTVSFGHRGKAAHRGPQLPDFMDISRLQELAAENLDLTEEEQEAAKTEGLRALDLDRATVVAALRDAWQQLVDEAVTSGTITQAEADELTFTPGLRDRAAHHGFQLPDFMDVDRLQELAAEAMDLTEEEQEAAKMEGFKSLSFDRTTVVAALQDAWQQLVDEEVTSDTITQAEADELTFNKNQVEQNDYNRRWRRGHGCGLAHSLVPTHG